MKKHFPFFIMWFITFLLSAMTLNYTGLTLTLFRIFVLLIATAGISFCYYKILS
jgi:hypothetical protein